MNEFASLYGKALYSLCKEEGKEDKILEELTVVENIFDENSDYIMLLDTPALKLEERIKLVDEAFFSLDEILVNFIKILTTKKAVREFIKCKKEYLKIYDKDNNVERAVAITAVPLSEAQLKKIKEKTELSLGKTVCIKNEISKDVIGGVILKLSDSQIDASIKGRIKELKTRLKNLAF